MATGVMRAAFAPHTEHFSRRSASLIGSAAPNQRHS
jgi:hypothetical protein